MLNAAQKVKRNIELRKLASKSKSENECFFIKVDAQQIKLEYSDIIFAESMRDYVKIYTENRDVPYIPLITLKRINELLPSEKFLQINRSQIINISKISSYGKSNLTIGDRKFAVTDKFREDFEGIKNKINQ